MKRKTITIVGVIIAVVILLKGIQLFAGGSIGLRQSTHGCLGLKIGLKKVENIFPKGNYCFSFPIQTCYMVGLTENGMSLRGNNDYCLGQDVWMGE